MTLVVSAPPPPPPPAPSGFSDGFESGDLSAWTVVSGSQLGVNAAARADGAYGMQAVIAGNTSAYVQDATPSAETSYSASFAFAPNGTDTGTAVTTVFAALNAGTTPTTALSVQFRTVKRPLRQQLRLSVARSRGTSTTGWFTVDDGFHRVGVSWSSARSASASLDIDGSTAQTLRRLDTRANLIETVRLGPSGGLGTKASGTEYFDSFTSGG